jgi:hypothetical protein
MLFALSGSTMPRSVAQQFASGSPGDSLGRLHLWLRTFWQTVLSRSSYKGAGRLACLESCLHASLVLCAE